MVQEIGITIPSLLTETITKTLEGKQIPVFNQLIAFIKLAQQGKGHTRPKEKKYIYQKIS